MLRANHLSALVSHPVVLSDDSDSEAGLDSSDDCVSPRSDASSDTYYSARSVFDSALDSDASPGARPADAPALGSAALIPVGNTYVAARPAPPAPRGLRLTYQLSRDIPAPIDVVARTICDSSQGHRWVDHCVESRVLLATSTGPIAYHRYALPVAGQRDCITRTTLTRSSAGEIDIRIQPWDQPHVALPPKTVRIPWVRGWFALTARDDATTHVYHESDLVPGGRIPGILAPVIRRKRPKTLERLARAVAEDL